MLVERRDVPEKFATRGALAKIKADGKSRVAWCTLVGHLAVLLYRSKIRSPGRSSRPGLQTFRGFEISLA